jgi:hypothetical protein
MIHHIATLSRAGVGVSVSVFEFVFEGDWRERVAA